MNRFEKGIHLLRQCWSPSALALVLCCAVLAARAAEVPEQGDGSPAPSQTGGLLLEETPVNGANSTIPATVGWVDRGHEYATNRAQGLAQWMDDFFGAPVQDAERADSFVRAIFLDNWESDDGHDLKLRLRGQISLPKISERVDLVFSGEESEQTLTEAERAQEDDIGVRFNFSDGKRTRVDATLSVRSGPSILPGVRFRYQQPISENIWGRFTQRLQYHTDDGFRSLTNIDLNRRLDERSLLRWGGRMRYEEDKGFWDWNTGVTYRRWIGDHERYPSAIEYFVSLSGRDDPEVFNNNYRVGFLYRKQFFRDFLYYELEPSYNWRRDEYGDVHSGVWGLVLRLEVMLDRDLVRGT
ncbi:MAG: hypothetical protein ACI87W_001965 [Halieaceae bacterium]|jgi:hypothetical protein